MIATSDDALYGRLIERRRLDERPVSRRLALRRSLYLLAAAAAFAPPFVDGLIWLETRTRALSGLTDYYRDDVIELPEDVLEPLSDLQAAVGLAQLERYPRILRRRREIAAAYDRHLGDLPRGVVKPPLRDGSTYSHYALRVPDRDRLVAGLLRHGVRAGRVIEYAVPDMAAYRPYRRGDYPNATLCSRSMVTLPCHPQMSEDDVLRVARATRALLRAGA